jgi:diguanylate cyclase (GGDEF)-like protein
LLSALPEAVAPFAQVLPQKPIVIAGYFLVLVGFLLLLRDLNARTGAQQAAREERFRAEEERRLRASMEKAKADLERANAELRRLAGTDGLTGLMNRRQAEILFDHEIALSRRNHTPLGVIFLDLDHFKAINDTHGHDMGDEALKHVAGLLRKRLRASDIVARYGGEEFLFILPGTDLEGAAQVAEDIRRVIQDNAFRSGEVQARLTGSFGVAMLPLRETLSADQLIRRADKAMYGAKKLGSNCVITWDRLEEDKIAPSLAVGVGQPRG